MKKDLENKEQFKAKGDFVLPKDIEIYSHSIVRVPCPHCSYLCSSQANNCPKCGEPIKPLYDPSEIGTMVQESNLALMQYPHIKQMEKEIKKKNTFSSRIKRK